MNTADIFLACLTLIFHMIKIVSRLEKVLMQYPEVR
jgi:hypothetical protein